MTNTTVEKYRVSEADADKILTWLRERGGILIWTSVDLSRPGESSTTPFRDPAGIPVGKPHWRFGDHPRHITDISEVEVAEAEKVESLAVRIKRGGELRLTLTSHSSAKLQERLAHWSQERNTAAWYHFEGFLVNGWDTAHIYVDSKIVPMQEWAEHAHPV